MSGHPAPGAGFHAWGDESGSKPGIDDGVYIMAAPIAEAGDCAELTEAMRTLLLPEQKKVHWRAESRRRRDTIVDVIAELPLEGVVVVRQGPKDDSDERRRRKVLERFLPTLDQLGCVELTLESRGTRLDGRDRVMLDALRTRREVSGLRLDHATGPSDPVLWIADAICGAIVADRTGDPRWRIRLEQKLTLDVIDAR